jgi:hypothetical protein
MAEIEQIKNGTLEILENKSSWGGRRKNSGRAKGSLNKATLEKKAVEAEFKQRILYQAQGLFNAQSLIAQGQQFLYKIEKYKEVGAKGGVKWIAKKPKLVTSEWEIREYLDNLVDLANGDLEDEYNPADTYYFITTKEPNNQAIDSMLDRVFGKARQTIGLDGGEGQPISLEEKKAANKAIANLLPKKLTDGSNKKNAKRGNAKSN